MRTDDERADDVADDDNYGGGAKNEDDADEDDDDDDAWILSCRLAVACWVCRGGGAYELKPHGWSRVSCGRLEEAAWRRPPRCGHLGVTAHTWDILGEPGRGIGLKARVSGVAF